jgi:hypothetical protein
MQTSFLPRAATRLSGVAPGAIPLSSRFRGLARLSLLFVQISMVSGCLVEDPPVYTEPTRTPPRINLRTAEPQPDRIILVEQGDPVLFRVPFSSEDVGARVSAFLFLDYSEKSKTPLASADAAGSTLDDDNRRIEITYPATDQVSFGCHRIMIRISHADNFLLFPSGAPINQADVAEAYWWMNVLDVAAGDDSSNLRNCLSGPAESGSTPR